jgi:hypothetical protein
MPPVHPSEPTRCISHADERERSKVLHCPNCGLQIAVEGAQFLSYSMEEWEGRCPHASELSSLALCQFLIGCNSSKRH